MIEVLLIAGMYLLYLLSVERHALNKILLLKTYATLISAYLVFTYGEEVSQILGMVVLLAVVLLATILLKTKNDESC